MDIQKIVTVTGKIQGVGFRPAVYCLANEMNIVGFVQNLYTSVSIFAQGQNRDVEKFIDAIRALSLPGCKIDSLIVDDKVNFKNQPSNFKDFSIRESEESPGDSALSAPFISITDRAICPQCLSELTSKERSNYPFNSCVNCGPRYTIINNTPFDRHNTSMHEFKLCLNCQNEYYDMHNRRFHAQTTSCPSCGPRLNYYPDLDNKFMSDDKSSTSVIKENSNRNSISMIEKSNEKKSTSITEESNDKYEKIIAEVADDIRGGSICAVKATGGFHLICDASNDKAVASIRQIKQRPEKPFAVMFSTIEDIEEHFSVNHAENKALLSAARPIVLLKAKHHLKESAVAASSLGEKLSCEVNRGIQHTGLFLPDSALYTLLLKKLNNPIVATSCNVSGEPLITSEFEFRNAFERGMFNNNKISLLTHNREIVNRCDDSVLSFVETSSTSSVDIANENRNATPLTEINSFAKTVSDNRTPSFETKEKVHKLSNSISPKDNSLKETTYMIPIRNAKGIAPFVQKLPFEIPQPTIALGAQQKSSITLAKGNEAIMSPHLGDLFSLPYEEAFDALCEQTMRQYRFTPKVIICDANPAYYSHLFGKQLFHQMQNHRENENADEGQTLPSKKFLTNGIKLTNDKPIEFKTVYHHHAHAMSLMAEHNFSKNDRLITAVWDGAGMGPDRTTWGGEILNAGYQDFERLIHFHPFYQMGGETGANYPYKTAASILFEVYGQDARNHCLHVWNLICSDIPLFDSNDNAKENSSVNKSLELTNNEANNKPAQYEGHNKKILGLEPSRPKHKITYSNLHNAWKNRTNMPLSTSAGRLFDAASSIINICHTNTYEAEAAIKLEDCADIHYTNFMTLDIKTKTENNDTSKTVDWRPLFEQLIKIKDPPKAAAFFINSMAQLLITISKDFGPLGLTGGVFQNRKLLYRTIQLAQQKKTKLYMHEKFPSNDGGISLGQAAYLGE